MYVQLFYNRVVPNSRITTADCVRYLERVSCIFGEKKMKVVYLILEREENHVSDVKLRMSRSNVLLFKTKSC